MGSRKALILVFTLGVGIGAFGVSVGADMLGSAVFRDVQPGAFYDAAVGKLYGAGIVKGVDGEFFPDRPVTRGEVAVMLDRALYGGSSPVASGTAGSSRSSRSRSSASSSSVSSVASSSSVAAVAGAGSFRFAVDKVSISEGVTTLSLSVQRVDGKTGSVSVKYGTAAGTATMGTDFNEATGTVGFGDQETSKIITVKMTNDLEGEVNETYTVALSDPGGGAGLGSPTTVTVTILDNDGGAGATPTTTSNASAASSAAGGLFIFSAFTYHAEENVSPATITVLRKGNTSTEAKVDYATADGTAKAGTFYSAAQGTLIFAPGETSKTFTVPIIDNSTIDGNKSLTLKLNNPTGGAALGAPNNVPMTIVDNEAIPSGSGSVVFSESSYAISEKGETATIYVLRRAGYSGTISVKYATSDSTATAGSDYTAATGTLTFAPNETKKSFTIAVTKDTLSEGEERVNLTLSDPVNATLGVESTSMLEITDQ